MPDFGMSLFGTVLGAGASKALNKPDTSAQRAQLAQNERAAEQAAIQAERAGVLGTNLFDIGQQNLLAGNQAAFNLQRDTLAPQMGAVQQGNLAAQQQIAGGLPQIKNALMGLQVDYSAFQPRTFTPDISTIQQAQAPVNVTPGQLAGVQRINQDLARLGLPVPTPPPMMVSPLGGVQQSQGELDQIEARRAADQQESAKQQKIEEGMSKLYSRSFSDMWR